jgi:hypothetical protein
MKPHFFVMTDFSFGYEKNYSENAGPQVPRFPSSLKNPYYGIARNLDFFFTSKNCQKSLHYYSDYLEHRVGEIHEYIVKSWKSQEKNFVER